jgi:hypothetical protein
MSSLLQAVAIMAAGKFLFAIQDVIIKEMSGAFPVHQIMTIRGLVAIPLLLILIQFTGGLGILRHHRAALHLVRGGFLLLLQPAQGNGRENYRAACGYVLIRQYRLCRTWQSLWFSVVKRRTIT